jgi:hypothetical protein
MKELVHSLRLSLITASVHFSSLSASSPVEVNFFVVLGSISNRIDLATLTISWLTSIGVTITLFASTNDLRWEEESCIAIIDPGSA